MAIEPERITITADGREIVCRRPTHGELDLVILHRVLATLVGYQQRVEALESAQDHSVVKLGNLLSVCNDLLDEVRARVRRALAAIASTDVVDWFDGGSEDERAGRALAVAAALVLELAPPGRLGK